MVELTGIYVLSLQEDRDRRAHVRTHFEQIGLRRYEFFQATEATSDAVRNAYITDQVVKFPTCFRCGKDTCACHNNILIPPQVANWLSYKRLWAELPNDPDEYFLLTEDDVVFHHNAIELLKELLDQFTREQPYVLIRLAGSKLPPYSDITADRLTTHSSHVMSNPAYILNGSMAGLLKREFPVIATTSDIWLHRNMAQRTDVQDLTVEPLLATELSFDPEFARFPSRIHPKGFDDADRLRKEKHIMRVETAHAYQNLRRYWVRG